DKPRTADAYTPARRVADIVAVLDALGIARTHLLGYSLGGMAAFAAAEQIPERLLSLAVGGADPFGKTPQDTAPLVTLFRQEGMAGFIARFERTVGPMPDGVAAQWLATNEDHACAAIFAALGAWPSSEAALPRLTLPTLLFCGEQDPAFAQA